MTDLWLYPLGVALGAEKVSAAELVEKYGPVREDFLDKTGFVTLYRSTDDQTGLTLATGIAESSGDWWHEAVDGLIYVTSTGTMLAPGNAHLLQATLGLKPSMLVLDVNDACTGFVRSLQLAHSLIATGVASTILLTLSDTYSKLYPPEKLKVSPLFSDGASAMIVSGAPLDGAPVQPRHWQVVDSWFLSEGSRSDELSISRDGEHDYGVLEMNGSGVFTFVLKHLPTCVAALEEAAGVDRSEITWYAHQGSRLVVNAVEKTVKAEPGSLFRSADYGNTVGSSLPFILYEDRAESGDEKTIGLLGFGVGLTMAGMVVRQIAADG